MIKKILYGIAVISITSTANAGSFILPNYTSLVESLNRGDDVSAIIHVEKCKQADAYGPKATTRINFNIFSQYTVMRNKVPTETVATSHAILTEHHEYGTVYAYSRVRVFPDQTVDLRVAYYDAESKSLKKSADFTCRLGMYSPDAAVTLIAKN